MHRKLFSLVFLALFLVCGSVQAQTTQADVRDAETNLETYLYIVIASNDDVSGTAIPTALDPAIKQLRGTLPFKNYRLASTLVNRVRNEGRLDLSWVGGPLASKLLAAPEATPSRSTFKVRQVKLVRNAEGQQMVQMTGFNFNALVPIPTGVAVAANGAAAPTFNYEGTSLQTDISMREGEPAIVGTLNIGPSGDAIILIVSAKQTQK
jgi:hypothetical protein